MRHPIAQRHRTGRSAPCPSRAARADRRSRQQRLMVLDLGAKVSTMAKWLGQVTHLANCFPDPTWDGSGRQQKLRDSEGVRRTNLPRRQQRPSRQALEQKQCVARNEQRAGVQLHDLSGNPRWAALRARIARKEAMHGRGSESLEQRKPGTAGGSCVCDSHAAGCRHVARNEASQRKRPRLRLRGVPWRQTVP